MQNSEQIRRNKNKNNKAKLRPALYVRTNAGKNCKSKIAKFPKLCNCLGNHATLQRNNHATLHLQNYDGQNCARHIQNYDGQNCARHLQNYDGQIVLGTYNHATLQRNNNATL
jgi:hypothetical protein